VSLVLIAISLSIFSNLKGTNKGLEALVLPTIIQLIGWAGIVATIILFIINSLRQGFA
jgi:hypothetical protein